MNDIIDEILLKLIINTKDINTIVTNCKFNTTIDKVCRQNQEFIGSELLKKRGYNNGNYSRFKRFFQLDTLLKCNVKNIIKLYKLGDTDLLDMILDVNYNTIDIQQLTIQNILDVIYEKNNPESLLFMKFIHWDLFETKQIPNEEIFTKLVQEHNNIFNTDYSLNEFIKLFTSKINEQISFTNITSLETKIAVMLKNWNYWIDNPTPFKTL